MLDLLCYIIIYMIDPVNEYISHTLARIIDFIPNVLGGIIVVCIGLILASILKRILLALLSFFRLASILQHTKLMNKSEVKVWEEVLAEVLRWTVVIMFLIPALEIWGLSRATLVLNNFLFYLPNVIVAVVIGFVGIIISNLIADLVRQSIHTLGASSSNALALGAKSILIFFTVLVAMNQLGIAQDLVKILFTGIIFMVALAGGLAFGLGGKDTAKDILELLKKKLK
jgi:hypothetical protein